MSEKNVLKKHELEKVTGGAILHEERRIDQDTSISTFDTSYNQTDPNNENNDGMVVQHNMKNKK